LKEKYIEDLKEIKEVMNRSTRFISLSGLSGVSTGIVAMGGVLFAYLTFFKEKKYLVYHAVELTKEDINKLLLSAVTTLILSIVCAVFFTKRKTKKGNQKIVNKQTRELLINLLIPLITGGLLCLMLLFKGFVGILTSLTLIFYGLALINASKYTLTELRNLGLIEILLGLLAFQFINYSLLFWAFGFGMVQIIYGLIIQRKY
jgi:hypothetical protein